MEVPEGLGLVRLWKDAWAVRKPGADRVSSIHRTQNAAINKAVQGAKAYKSEVVIHGRD